MYQHYLLSLWIVLVGSTMASDQEVGSEYRNWCSHSADAEKLSAIDRENYIQECMNSLVEADRNPDRSRKDVEGEDDG